MGVEKREGRQGAEMSGQNGLVNELSVMGDRHRFSSGIELQDVLRGRKRKPLGKS